ncbi:jg21550 [Pararge aegeria aegeria]|uniref:Jg21550 protein n=1 Tax=Pararge aegeria aegeria TaxID=348720 RepID=A0A8S4RR39_9NEOP|nr:jg21550 [Pararge aegeria aegeria]
MCGRSKAMGQRVNVCMDAELVADLAKILRQAEQTVADFLERGGTATYKGNKYGGSDIRVGLQYFNLYL